MAGRQKSGGRSTNAHSARASSSKSANQDAVSDIYREMLAEAVPSLAKSDEDGKAVKKRRVGGRLVTYGAPKGEEPVGKDESGSAVPDGAGERIQQTFYDDTGESSEGGIDWEEVNLENDADGSLWNNVPEPLEEVPLDIRLDKQLDTHAPKIQRRKPVTGLEKRMRLDVHKTHLLCLLAHVSIRNHWSNDVEIQENLRSMLSTRTKSFLNPSEDKSQFEQSKSFMMGLEQVLELWKRVFKITARGMRRGYWAENEEHSNILDDFESIPDKETFSMQGKNRIGSRDFGAQLLCALLRSVAVEARLVCSLQPLPFLGVAKGITPQKPNPTIINASDLDSHGNTTDDASGADAPVASPIPPPRVRRLGRPEFAESKAGPVNSRPPRQDRPKRIKESPYPVFWIEALNEASQKWVPFDPIVTRTIAKPSKFEPPSSDPENNMSYVIAFEEDGSAVDITRRYTKLYNAKTRKNRVESTRDGERWWRRTMNHYKKSFQEDRDQVEAGELAAKEAAEPMPRNVQDFKDHPLYALERHLRRNEVIQPRREVGKVTAGKISLNKSNAPTEPVFRRRDVHVVRSAEGWYRLGREIKSGEQPLKRAAPRRNKEVIEDEDGMEEEDPSVGLYAAFQTDMYRPPPVVNGKIPKNVYGNLDVYTPNMVPGGGFHLQHPQGVRAATLLGIDYAEAVTGFEFKGRQGQAVFQGVVVAIEFREAVLEVLRAFQDEKAQALEEKKTLRALNMWKRLLLRLRIKQKVEKHGADFEKDDNLMGQTEEDEDEGGGFFPDRDEAMAEPIGGSAHFEIQDDLKDEGGRFMAHDEPEEGLTPPAIQKGKQPALETIHIPESRPKPSPRKKRRPRYILQIRSLDDPDPYYEKPDLTAISNPGPTCGMTAQDAGGPKETEAVLLPTSNDASQPVLDPELRLDRTEETDDHALLTDDLCPQGMSRVAEDSESELEKTSLMSHDPDDEDADPEWVDTF